MLNNLLYYRTWITLWLMMGHRNCVQQAITKLGKIGFKAALQEDVLKKQAGSCRCCRCWREWGAQVDSKDLPKPGFQLQLPGQKYCKMGKNSATQHWCDISSVLLWDGWHWWSLLKEGFWRMILCHTIRILTVAIPPFLKAM